MEAEIQNTHFFGIFAENPKKNIFFFGFSHGCTQKSKKYIYFYLILAENPKNPPITLYLRMVANRNPKRPIFFRILAENPRKNIETQNSKFFGEAH